MLASALSMLGSQDEGAVHSKALKFGLGRIVLSIFLLLKLLVIVLKIKLNDIPVMLIYMWG